MKKTGGRATSKRQPATSDFLLEIGCEELPADYLPPVLNLDSEQMQDRSWPFLASAVLNEYQVSWKRLQVYGTLRRLVLCVRGVEGRVLTQAQGPPVQVAFDPQGNPTPAALGFAKRQGVEVSQLQRKPTPQGERLYVEHEVPVGRVLSEAIPALIGAAVFPKTMRWNESGVRFARPIRWLLALWGVQQIPCAFAGLQSGRVTQDPRRKDGRGISVKDPAAYFSLLQRMKIQLEEGLGVVNQGGGVTAPFASQRHKREDLLRALRAKARQVQGQLADEGTEEFRWLLSNVTFLAETPVVLAGNFHPEYLALPPAVLATAMAKHLKLFSVHGPARQKLLPRFLAVLEGKPRSPSVVAGNLKRILEARFADARFFYREDTQTGLEEKLPALSQIVFHAKLGSVGERVARLERLVENLCGQLSLSSEIRSAALRAARLCKADLVTQMVKEFPSLQGVMGGHYALAAGEAASVARAVEEHYQPRTGSDSLPQTLPGALVSLADRCDTLLGFFAADMKPTGSFDPYALRRQALGLIRILVESRDSSWVGLSIDRLFEVGIESLGSMVRDGSALKRELNGFLQERFEWLACQRVERVFRREMIQAVLAAGRDDWADAWQRLQTLRQLWEKKDAGLLRAAKVAERTGRIVATAAEEASVGAVDPERFSAGPEQTLWSAWEQFRPQVEAQVRQRRYREAVSAYSELYAPLHAFFDSVMVMDSDPALRRNRLAFMRQIHHGLAGRFADLSLLPLSGVEIRDPSTGQRANGPTGQQRT